MYVRRNENIIVYIITIEVSCINILGILSNNVCYQYFEKGYKIISLQQFLKS